jgi:hypothetical protein
MVLDQLDAELDNNIKPLSVMGARGAMFVVTLAAFRYTFLAKGFVPVLSKYLQREANVYKQLTHLHSTSVPMFLGTGFSFSSRMSNVSIVHTFTSLAKILNGQVSSSAIGRT